MIILLVLFMVFLFNHIYAQNTPMYLPVGEPIGSGSPPAACWVDQRSLRLQPAPLWRPAASGKINSNNENWLLFQRLLMDFLGDLWISMVCSLVKGSNKKMPFGIVIGFPIEKKTCGFPDNSIRSH